MKLERTTRAEFIICNQPIIERFFRSLKEECVWQHTFATFAEARTAVLGWIEWYNAERPHQALGYRSPRQFQQHHHQQAA